MHTPTPWQTGKSCDGFLTITDGSKTICTVGEADMFDGIEDDAALIVRAVNSYEALKSAIEEARDMLCVTESGYSAKELLTLIEQVKNDILDPALALAEGKE